MFKTVAYADVFDYPLTTAEINRWLIKGDSNNGVVKTGNYYHLPGREKILQLRRQRHYFSRIKWQRARRLVKLLTWIPWVCLIGVTGALAMDNARRSDDIDLMIITSRDRLWLTRILASLLLWPWLRRGHLIHNRVCLNLWLDETALTIKPEDLYLTHELCQMKPIFERDNTYKKFIGANLWYKKFLPNWKI